MTDYTAFHAGSSTCTRIDVRALAAQSATDTVRRIPVRHPILRGLAWLMKRGVRLLMPVEKRFTIHIYETDQ